MPRPKLLLLLLFVGPLAALSPLCAQEVLLLPGLDQATVVTLNGDTIVADLAGNGLSVPLESGLNLVSADGDYQLVHSSEEGMRRIPLWLSILPPLIAIGLALLFKEVIISLFAGVWVGAFIAGGLRFNAFLGVIEAMVDTVATYIINALNDSGHLSVIVFSLLIGGMVAIISRNGGMAGVVHRLTKYAKTPRSAQFITWLLGVGIFFDDYANTLIVGNTMRSVTDRFRISREKLAYIVDSTAAPVASVAFITTWIGAELGYIDDGISQVAYFDGTTPYAVFIESLKYSFYPVLTLAFILFLVWQQRDFGAMRAAEERARATGEVKATAVDAEATEEQEDLEPVAGAPLRSRNALIPVLTVVIVTVIGLMSTGLAAEGAWSELEGGFFGKLGTVIGSADSYVALLWASISGVVVAIGMTLAQRIMNIAQTMGALTAGFKSMFGAVMILTLAWALAITTEELHTATFLVELLGESLSPYLLPPVIFVLAAFISFSTGSSWSTMAILYPIAIPLTWAVTASAGWAPDDAAGILYNVISIVLAASVLGDHCSPISDTTILSSLASDCNHIDHVRTQLPYALTVGAVAISCGTLASVLGGGWLVCGILMASGLALLFAVVKVVGKPIEAHTRTTP